MTCSSGGQAGPLAPEPGSTVVRDFFAIAAMTRAGARVIVDENFLDGSAVSMAVR